MLVRKSILFLSSFLFAGCATIHGYKEKEVTESDFVVRYEYYEPDRTRVDPITVVILPPTGGINYIDRSYARALAKEGAHVLVMKFHTGEGEKSLDLGLHERVHSAALRAVGMMLKVVPKDHQVSILGTSLGGLYGAIAVNRYPEVDRILIIGAGAPIPKIIAESTTEGMQYLREKRAKKFQFPTSDAYAAAIDAQFTMDPLKTGDAYKQKELGMIIFTKDTAVPTKYQMHLKNVWKPSFLIERENTHFWGIVNTWLHEFYKVRDYLLGQK